MTNDDQRPDHAYRRIKAIVESGAAPPLRDRDDWVSGNLHLVMQARKKKRALNPICESHAAPVLEALSIYETRGSPRWRLEAALLADVTEADIARIVPLCYGCQTSEAYRRLFLDVARWPREQQPAVLTAADDQDLGDASQHERDFLRALAFRWGDTGMVQYLAAADAGADLGEDLQGWMRRRLQFALLRRAAQAIETGADVPAGRYLPLCGYVEHVAAGTSTEAEAEFRRKSAEADRIVVAFLDAVEQRTSEVEEKLGKGPIEFRDKWWDGLPEADKAALTQRMQGGSRETQAT